MREKPEELVIVPGQGGQLAQVLNLSYDRFHLSVEIVKNSLMGFYNLYNRIPLETPLPKPLVEKLEERIIPDLMSEYVRIFFG